MREREQNGGKSQAHSGTQIWTLSDVVRYWRREMVIEIYNCTAGSRSDQPAVTKIAQNFDTCIVWRPIGGCSDEAATTPSSFFFHMLHCSDKTSDLATFALNYFRFGFVSATVV